MCLLFWNIIIATKKSMKILYAFTKFKNDVLESDEEKHLSTSSIFVTIVKIVCGWNAEHIALKTIDFKNMKKFISVNASIELSMIHSSIATLHSLCVYVKWQFENEKKAFVNRSFICQEVLGMPSTWLINHPRVYVVLELATVGNWRK